MNKSAVFRLKLSFPNVSGLALHQWNYQFVLVLTPYKGIQDSLGFWIRRRGFRIRVLDSNYC